MPTNPGEDVVEEPVKSREQGRSAARELLETLLLALLIFIAVRSVVLNFRVDGNSMEPTLHNHEMLIVNRRQYLHIDFNALLDLIPGVSAEGERMWYPFSPPRRGDIVVFMPPGESAEPYIKRIIGLPGDRIAIHDGAVYVNGNRLEEPYLRAQTTWRGITAGREYVVEPGHVFVLGDNRNNSSDSRVFGAVPISNIIGKAWLAYWPPSEMQILPHPAYAMDETASVADPGGQ